MKRNLGTAGGMRATLEKNMVGENVIFLDLGGNSFQVAAFTKAQARNFAKKLRAMANKVDEFSSNVGAQK